MKRKAHGHPLPQSTQPRTVTSTEKHGRINRGEQRALQSLSLHALVLMPTCSTPYAAASSQPTTYSCLAWGKIQSRRRATSGDPGAPNIGQPLSPSDRCMLPMC